MSENLTKQQKAEIHEMELRLEPLKRKLVNITTAMEEPLGVTQELMRPRLYCLRPVKEEPGDDMPQLAVCEGPFEAMFHMLILMELKRQGKAHVRWEFIPSLKDFVSVTYAKEEAEGDLLSYATH